MNRPKGVRPPFEVEKWDTVWPFTEENQVFGLLALGSRFLQAPRINHIRHLPQAIENLVQHTQTFDFYGQTHRRCTVLLVGTRRHRQYVDSIVAEHVRDVPK